MLLLIKTWIVSAVIANFKDILNIDTVIILCLLDPIFEACVKTLEYFGFVFGFDLGLEDHGIKCTVVHFLSTIYGFLYQQFTVFAILRVIKARTSFRAHVRVHNRLRN